MSADERPDDGADPPTEGQPADPLPPGPPGPAPSAESHDDTGLDLARSIARSLARPGAARRRGPSERGGRRRPRVDPQSSGAHPDDRDPQLLDATISRLIGEQGWATDVRVHGVFSRWEALVGREVAAHCQPESFQDGGVDAATGAAEAPRGGRLVVRTDSTAWATQVRLLAPTLLRRLNAELGDGTVGFIEVRGPQAPSWSRGRRSVRDGRGPRDTYG